MGNLLIMPVGEKEAPLKKAVSSCPDVDAVYLLPTSKTLSEAQKLASLFRRMEIQTSIEQISPTDIIGIMKKILEILKKENRLSDAKISARRTPRKCVFETEGHQKAADTIINITGGTKPMAAASLLAACFTGAKVIYVYEDGGKMSVIDIPTIGFLTDRMLSGQQLSVLCCISSMQAPTAGKICRALGISKQNANYYLRLLESLELIVREKGCLKPTQTGRMLLLFQKKE